MRHFRWIITVPLAVILAVFAVNNRDDVDVNLWPADFILSLPLFAFVLGAVVIGFFAGAIVTWLSAGDSRRIARQRRRRITELQREVESLHREATAREESSGTPPARID